MDMPKTPFPGDVHEGKDLGMALAIRLQQKDSLALEEIYDLYSKLCYSLAYRIVSDHARAEDVVQEAFLKAWNKSATLDLNKGTLRSWLLTIVRNKAIDSLRGNAGHGLREKYLPESIPSQGMDPFTAVFRQLEKERVHRAIAKLSDFQKEVIMLAYFECLTQKEMAQRLDVPLSTIKGRIRCAMENIDSYLREGVINDATR